MTVAAIILLTCTALIPPAAAGYRSSAGTHAQPSKADIGAAVAIAVLAAIAALLALPTVAVSDTALVIARVLSTAAAVTCGGTLVRAVLFAGGVGRTDTTPPDSPGADSPDPDAPGADTPASGEGPLRGGHIIGYLERLAVIGSLHAAWPAGLAVILAVKGLARYPELRSPQASEQFIVGTFVSVLWAAAMFGLAQLIIT